MVMGDLISVEKSSMDESDDYSDFEYFERGSEWRKWDLHLHTPSSFDYSDMSVTNEEIIESLKSNEISAAVITDHHYIDVERIKELAELGKKENILILPGIELRSELGGSETIHFIGIFPIENLDTTWEKIKGKLELTKHDIETVGNEKVYKDLADSCKIFHELGGITTIHAGTKSNSIENLKNYFLHKQNQKEDLLKNSIDILEIGKEENIDDYKSIIFPQIGFKVPLVMGSDNHDIKEYNLKENCWIKADLCFEGLKQIIYEPEERVRIQEVFPDKKHDYAVIERVKFEDGNFIEHEIVLNSNLVSIIGGRSTGKSIFLRSIARAIDKNYVEDVCGDVSKLINPHTIVKWKNGNEDNSEDNSENKIIYIPQNFLNNQITEAEDSFSHILIRDILKTNEDYKENFENIDSHIHNFGNKIHSKITKLFEAENKLTDLEKRMKELGNPEDVQNEIEKLNKEYNEHHSKEDISENDKKLQEKLMEELVILNKKISMLKSDESILNKSLGYLTSKKTFFDRDIIYDLSELTKIGIDSAIADADAIYKDSLNKLVIEKTSELQKDIEKIQKEIISKEENLEIINEKLNSSKLAEDIFKKIDAERAILSLIMDKTQEIEKTKKDIEDILKNIFEIYSSFIENLECEQSKFSFSEEYNSFEAELSFKTKEFQNCINSLNKRKFRSFEEKSGIDLSEFEYDEVNFQKNLELIIQAILNDILTPKGSKNKKNLIQELLGAYHFIKFNIVEDGERLEIMSPGKRSFALLKVLIESDKSKWPILLDQPEDDLDANSISKSLSKFLREKKRNRQIIIVSHNPNLVVGADSEQVIIANQDGSDSENKSKRFEYISGSIENIFKDENETCYLYCKGIKDHICDILEGGEESFKKRQNKYNIE